MKTTKLLMMSAAVLSLAIGFTVQAKVQTKEDRTMKFEDNMMQAEDRAIAKEEKDIKQLDVKLIAMEKESVKGDERRIKADEERLVNCHALMAKHEKELKATNISDKSRKFHEQANQAQAKRCERLEKRIASEKGDLATDKEKLKNNEKTSNLAQN